MLFASILIFLIGACIGSFLNVVIDRLPQKRSIWKGRSVCDSCHKKLGPLELIPIVSYIALSGRCKACHAKIPLRLTLVELLTAIIFTASYIFLPIGIIELILVLVVVCINIAIFFIDLDYGIIPDELVVIFVITSLLSIVLFAQNTLINHLFTGLITFLLFFALFIVTRGKGLGFGDVN